MRLLPRREAPPHPGRPTRVRQEQPQTQAAAARQPGKDDLRGCDSEQSADVSGELLIPAVPPEQFQEQEVMRRSLPAPHHGPGGSSRQPGVWLTPLKPPADQSQFSKEMRI